MSNFKLGKEFAEQCDAKDPLRSFRDKFHFPEIENCRYLCGNSLGLMPKKASEYVQNELDDWARYGVEGHFHGSHPWLPYHESFALFLAELVGAQEQEVVAMNTLTVNLHLMMVSFYRPVGKRKKILMGYSPFPSDRYAVLSQLRFHGCDPEQDLLEVKPREGSVLVDEADIQATIRQHGDEIALVLVEGVNYYTGQALLLPSIIQTAHEVGAHIGIDLAHTIGNMPLQLHEWEADFAVWCSYKYLNGGPGCIAGAFVHEKHAKNNQLPRFAGWWGSQKDIRFKMGPEFHPIVGAEGWQLSNPPIFSLAALRASLECFYEAGLKQLREKSIQLTGYFEYLLKNHCSDTVKIFTPEDPQRRGAQLSLHVQGGREVFDAITAKGVVCDWREPDVIRLAPTPLYNSFSDVYSTVQTLQECYE